MELLPADYAICAATLVLAILFAIRGLSGVMAFVVATVAAVFAVSFGWPYSETLTGVVWQRAVGVGLATLLVFGIVRAIARKFVNGMLAQPADAIFGFLFGAALCAALVLAWALSGLFPEYSAIVREVAARVG